MTMRFSKPRALTSAQQFLGLRTNEVCVGSGSMGTAGFTWRYEARPTLMSRSYSMLIEFRTGEQPEVYVDQPDLVALADGRKIPHVYSQSPTWLCLHRPVKGEWRPHMLIDRSIVPWAILWLFYFEEWLASDEWKGGGEHFGADHAPHGIGLQEGI
jgi:hypothetical protein